MERMTNQNREVLSKLISIINIKNLEYEVSQYYKHLNIKELIGTTDITEALKATQKKGNRVNKKNRAIWHND